MNTMMLTTSTWGQDKTFKLIPVSPDCPYNEVIFDPGTKVLAIISKEKKQSMHMVAKLNEQGDPEYLKIGKRNNGKDYKEERKTLETFYEYYIEDKTEIKEFVALTAVNATTFDINGYLDAPDKIVPTTGPMIQTAL